MNLRLFVTLIFVLAAATAQAHDARPNYVQVTETEPNTFSVMWKVPASMPGGALPYPTLPEGCIAERQPAWQLTGADYLGQQVFRCDEGLSGRRVTEASSAARLAALRHRTAAGDGRGASTAGGPTLLLSWARRTDADHA